MKAIYSMIKDLILGRQSNATADEDKELLLELLKAERKADKERIESQRRTIVEMTVSRNELLAKFNGVNSEDALMDHVRDLEENARKMAQTLTLFEDDVRKREVTISQRDVQIGGLQKKIAELNAVIDKQVTEIADISADKERLAKTLELREEDIKDLKEALAERDSKKDTGIFDNMNKDVADFMSVIDKTTSDKKETMEKNLSIRIKSECPFGVEQSVNKTAVVGGRYCRAKCPYYEGLADNGKDILCSKGN